MMLRIIVGALGLVAGVAATPLEIVERSSCRDDSLYKCFADYEYSHSASVYCSALAPCTKTVTVAKPTVTKTVWQTHTAPTSTCLVQSTTTVYTRTVPSSTVVKTSTQVVTKTSTATATITASVPIIEPFKRAVGGAKPQPPKCMLNKCFAYTPERITAACRCINVPPKTITATHTACSTTKTVTSTSTITPKVTATAWHTVATTLANGATTTCTTTTITTTVTTTTTTTTTTAPVTLPYTTPATTPATTQPTTPATTPITTAAATTSPAAHNFIPDGDFSSGPSPWSQINTNPAAWVNPNVNNANSPDGTSPNFQVTNVANSGLFFLASPKFALQTSSTYTFTFYASNTDTDTSWVGLLAAEIACGSYSLATPDMTKATSGRNGYLFSSTTFNTLTSTNPQVLQQLGNCQAQIVFHSGVAPVNSWFLADVGVSYVGPMAPVSTSAP